jgi:hypothetical protein
MAGMIESKLTELGLTLPALAAPIANYVGFVRTGDLLFVSGQLCLGADGKLVRSTCSPRSRPPSATSTAWFALFASGASSARCRRSWTARRS